jgi:prevent-host-death family protein
MESVGAYEAKTHLPKLLARVAKGERITITKHGVPVAVLQPPDAGRTEDPKKVIGQIKAFRKKHKLGSASLRRMIEEGRE